MVRISFLVFLSLQLANDAIAQDPPQLLQTVIVDVKNDKIDEFVALQKEYNALVKKAGMPRRTIWQVSLGPTAQFRITTPMSNLAEYDSDGWFVKAVPDAGQRANWVGRVTECVARREVVVSRVYPEMSIPRKDGKTPKNILIYVTENLNGKMGEYRRLLAEQLIPAYKKSGVEGVTVMQRLIGGNQRTFLVSRGFEKWKELDEGVNLWRPAIKALGEDKFRELAFQGGSLLARQERIVITRRDDLSFSNQ